MKTRVIQDDPHPNDDGQPDGRANGQPDVPVEAPRGIAARAAHWSAAHRKKAIFGWLAFALVAFFVGNSRLGRAQAAHRYRPVHR